MIKQKNFTFLKLPKIVKAGVGIINETLNNQLKLSKNPNLVTGTENKSNNSMEIQTNTYYSKQNIKLIGKKV